MTDPALTQAFEVTWPAAEYAQTGGFTLGRGLGAGGRVSSARATGDWTEGDIDAAIGIHRMWDQSPIFRVSDDDKTLITALDKRGFQRVTPTVILTAAIPDLTDRDLPPVTTFAVWPPMAIQRDIWTASGINTARQQVMERAPQPKTALLGRIKDRAAGAGFVAMHQDIAMLHALEILPDWRRLGLAGWVVRKAAFWAAQQGATRLGLAVTRDNAPALALYRQLGFTEVAGYSYWQVPE